MSRLRAARATFSRTERARKMLVTWKVYTMPASARRHAGVRVMSRPSKRIRPALGRTRPQTMPTSVVLPAPFGPMIA